MERRKAINALLWLLVVAYAVLVDLADGVPGLIGFSFTIVSSVVVPLAFGLIHGGIRYGITGILVFLVVCLGVSNIMENIGVLTGFPFGHYHYTDVLGAKLFLVPLLIGPAYFGAAYLSWVLANIFLGTDRSRDTWSTVAVPVVATFIMVGWDVCLDPAASTVAHEWIWENGGGFFGVPFVNFLGWYLTVFILMQLFALYRAATPEHDMSTLPASRWYLACAMYAVMGADFIAGYAGSIDAAVPDAVGKVWRSRDIDETAAVISIYTMLFASALGAVIVWRRATAAARS
jgi:uncharacterized membrane protein